LTVVQHGNNDPLKGKSLIRCFLSGFEMVSSIDLPGLIDEAPGRIFPHATILLRAAL
jgi:hypothetical protein